MNSTDLSIALLESLTADMRALTETHDRRPARRQPFLAAMTLVTGLLSIWTFRGI